MSQEQNRGPGAKKVELEKRLDSNTAKAKRGLAGDAVTEKAGGRPQDADKDKKR